MQVFCKHDVLIADEGQQLHAGSMDTDSGYLDDCFLLCSTVGVEPGGQPEALNGAPAEYNVRHATAELTT